VEIKNRQTLLLIVAAVAIGLWVADSIAIEPLIASWKDRSKRIENLKTDLAKGQALIKNTTYIRDTWDRMRTNTLDSADVSLAESDLLKSFDRWAKDAGIAVAGIHPAWKQTSDDYQTLECRAEATGNIESLAKFLYNVEKAHSIRNGEKEHIAVRIDSVDVTARDPQGQQLAINVTVSGLQIGQTPP